MALLQVREPVGQPLVLVTCPLEADMDVVQDVRALEDGCRST